jgi:tripartite-type tricarboxylate transporter receptor subunit TctC
MIRSASIAVLAAWCSLGATRSAPALEAIADAYAGKSITLIVGSDAGGGYDTNARVMARHLGKHIPGNPGVLVKNMPGAGSIVAANFIYNVAPKDGTVIGLIQRGNLLAKIVPQPVQYDLEKIEWIGNLSTEPGLVVAWHTAPQKTTADLFSAEMTVGGSGPLGENETIPRLLNAFLGTKFKVVSGYPSNNAILLAMERGEVQGVGDWTWANIKSRRPEFLREHKIKLLMLSGLEREADLPDVPLAQEFARSAADRQAMEVFFSLKTVARPIMAAPGVPKERIAALREAFMAMARDPDFLQDAQKSGLDVNPTTGEAVARVVQRIAATPPDMARRLADAISPLR